MRDRARLMVTGGRNFTDREFIWSTLDRLHQDIDVRLLIHGCATGVDQICMAWAIANGIEHDPNPALWDKVDGIPARQVGWRHGRPYNKLAGYERNQRMIDTKFPTHAAIFPGGNGTEDCARRIWQAIQRGQQIERLDFSGGRLGVSRWTGKPRYEETIR